MTKVSFVLFALLIAIPGCANSDEALLSRVQKSMHNSASYMKSISTDGGYAGFTSLDRSIRWGEGPKELLSEHEIWIQPPGTSKVGQCFLKAYKVTGDRFYLDLARDAARALAWSQTVDGGWDQIATVTDMNVHKGLPQLEKGRATFDDNVVQNAIIYLMELNEILDEEWLDNSIELGLNFMMKTQFKNGAWAQGYPPAGNYRDYYTFNDNVINDCIKVMIEAHRRYGRNEYLESIRQGGDFLILSQIDAPQSGWAQQYSHDMKPAPARKYEHPSVCSAVTSSNIRMLTDIYLYTKDEKYLEPIPAAISWLKNSGIGENLWARFYELGSNKALYSDQNGNIFYSVDKARGGYTWQGDFRIETVIEYYSKVTASNPDTVINEQNKPLSHAERERQIENSIPGVEESLASLDTQGRWLNPNDSMIRARDFVRNFSRLVKYVELAGHDTGSQ